MWKPRKTVGQMVEEAKTRIENLSVEEVEAEMARGDVQVVDIRDVRERKKLGFIPGSTHVPRGWSRSCTIRPRTTTPARSIRSNPSSCTAPGGSASRPPPAGSAGLGF